MDKDIFMNLSWKAPLDSQKRVINELASMVSLNPNIFIQPLSKEYWENAAKVLRKIGYPRIEGSIPGLFSWLQDMNWPGAVLVMELLNSLPKDAIIRHLESAANEACKTDDEIWLINLSSFLTKFKLQEHDFTSIQVYSVLADARED